jgi:hypothetical protein
MGYYNWADRQLQDLMTKDPVYTKSRYPGMRVGLGNQLYNGRMFGATDIERNLLSNQANYQAQVGRNATDSSSALAAYAAGEGMTDQGFSDLATEEKQNKYQLLSNLNEAYGAATDEDRLVEQDKTRRYGDLVQLKGAQAANKRAKRKALWNTVSDIGNFAVSAATSGLMPGFGGMGASAKALGGG